MRNWRVIVCALVLMGGHAVAQVPACETLAGGFRQTGPEFVASYPSAPAGPLHEVAFLYDNAVDALALVACGDPRHAVQIADAMLIALDHDRYWRDGRLRNGYLAGVVADRPVKLPGWWDSAQNKWMEDNYQVGSDTGNLAWAMLALLAVHRATGGPQYLAGAQRIAVFIEKSFSPLGFTGGAFGEEPEPQVNTWKSTEHNTDLVAAFRQLATATGNPHWKERAEQAEVFVRSMWKKKCVCFAVGTTADGHTRNNLLALDAQIWPLLVLTGNRYARAKVTARRRLWGHGGYAYGEGRDGVWTEGTAQVRLLLSLQNNTHDAEALDAALARNRGPSGMYYASSTAQLPTGFMLDTDPGKPRLYFHIEHVAATAWVALAEMGFNPFAGDRILPGLSK